MTSTPTRVDQLQPGHQVTLGDETESLIVRHAGPLPGEPTMDPLWQVITMSGDRIALEPDMPVTPSGAHRDRP